MFMYILIGLMSATVSIFQIYCTMSKANHSNYKKYAIINISTNELVRAIEQSGYVRWFYLHVQIQQFRTLGKLNI